MKGFYLLFAFGLLAPVPSAQGASLAFRDSFHAYVKMRQLEEENSLLSLRSDIEAEEKAVQTRKLAAKLTDARIDFHSILRTDRASLSPWELQTLERVEHGRPPKAGDKAALEFLSQTFPRARAFSPLEWQAVTEWFGQAAQDAFLHLAFSMEAAPTEAALPPKGSSVVWVTVTHSPLLPKAEIEQQKAQQDELSKQLSALGYDVKEVPVSPFSRIEDQAAELELALGHQAEEGSFVLLSTGSASAVLLKTFDLHPALLNRKEVLGWLNLNGQLFGRAQDKKSRSPASIPKTGPSYRQDRDAQAELMQLRHDRLERQPPLGAKFKILNVVTLDEHFRPSKNLRECLVPEGKTFYLSKGNGLAGLKATLPSLSASAP